MSAKISVPVVGNLVGLNGGLRPALAIATFILGLLLSNAATDSYQLNYALLITALSFTLYTVNSLALQAAFLTLAILLVIRVTQLTALPTKDKVLAWFLLGFAVAYLFA